MALERSRTDLPAAAGPTAYLVALGDAAREAVFALAHELRSRGVAAELDYVGPQRQGSDEAGGAHAARDLRSSWATTSLPTSAVTVKTLATGEEWRGARVDAIARIVEAGEDGR